MSESKVTPGEWKFGVRRDGSMWLSLGNPRTGPHYQGDLCASVADARVMVQARELLETLKEAELDCRGYDALHGWLEKAERAIAKAEGRA